MALFLWDNSASASSGRDQWRESFVAFAHLHHCHDNSALMGLFLFSNEATLMIWTNGFVAPVLVYKVSIWEP